MRLIHFALALTIVLLAITGYLAWEGQQEARGARRELDFLKQQQQAQMAAGAVPAASTQALRTMTPPLPGQIAIHTPPATPQSVGGSAGATAGRDTSTASAAPSGIAGSLPPAPPVAAPPPLTLLQKRVLSMPAIGKVKEYQKDAGFVVISAGSQQRVAKGTKFDLRRDNAVVGRITVTDTIEATESVADLDPASVPAGVTVEVGDEVIQVVSP